MQIIWIGTIYPERSIMDQISEFNINNAKARIRGLIDLQKRLQSLYGENNYNVFVFGSYPTVKYDETKSDVDIAVYTPDIELYKKIALEIEEFFSKKDISTDLFFIDLSFPAPIYLAPLHAQIQFTDYYPQELKTFESKCNDALKKINEKMAV